MQNDDRRKSFIGSLAVHIVVFLVVGYVGYHGWQKQEQENVHTVDLVATEETKDDAPGSLVREQKEQANATLQPRESVSSAALKDVADKSLVESTDTLSEQQMPSTEKTTTTSAQGKTQTGAVTGNAGSSGEGKPSGKSKGSGKGSSGSKGSDHPDYSRGPTGSGRGNYDKAAIRRSIQGSVTIRALLAANGTIQSAAVASSSGYGAIDSMGLRDIYNARYTPRLDKNGKPTACYITKTFTYKLN